MSFKRIILVVLIILIIVGAFTGFKYYNMIKGDNVPETTFIFIPSKADYTEVQNLLKPHINNLESFVWVADKKNYPNKIRAGKFKISQGMSNEELVNHLRGGEPETVQLTFNNQDSFEDLAGRISTQLEPDSIAILKSISDTEFLNKNGFNSKTGIAMFLPNSYEFYWNSSAEKYRNKMLSEYRKFWNKDRISKANKLGLNPIEVATLASIVQKETSTVSERPMVAGLYLNRLKDKWPLQADPTIIYAIKESKGKETIIKRVLNEDLSIDSPYNTYINTGLPPGPICMPDISSIEAVLNPAKHKYYYMCASVDNIGQHEFAKTLGEHNRNARKYQNWINKQGIKR